jgi:hypothetical protein
MVLSSGKSLVRAGLKKEGAFAPSFCSKTGR